MRKYVRTCKCSSRQNNFHSTAFVCVCVCAAAWSCFNFGPVPLVVGECIPKNMCVCIAELRRKKFVHKICHKILDVPVHARKPSMTSMFVPAHAAMSARMCEYMPKKVTVRACSALCVFCVFSAVRFFTQTWCT